jgi:hypothetical protein
MAFTRNPFLLELMEFGHIIKPRRNKKDFEFFQNIPKLTHDAFAWLRPSGEW